MDKQKLGKKEIWKATVTVAVVMMVIIPVSSTFESENTFADTIIRIHPDMQIVKKGETFNASIEVVPGPGKTIISVDVGVLSFDPTRLQANSVAEGDLFTSYKTFTPGIINNTAGTITSIAGNATPAHATIYPGIFCSISFTAQDEIGTSFLDIEDAVVANTTGASIPITVNNGSVTIIAWSMMLNFSETGPNSDYVVFGEIHDAIDGAPADVYDIAKPPAHYPPYIRAWFDDDLPAPDNFLLEDYRRYPDTYKVWDLYAKWESDDPTNVMISWNNNEFNSCEYTNITLMRYNPFPMQDPVGWEFATDMLTENNYTYVPRYFSGMWLTDHFQIIASDPVISDVTMSTSDPKDTSLLGNPAGFTGGWENITCIVTDNIGVRNVKLIATNPDENTIEYPMANIPSTNTYYYNTTFTIAGCYSYHIWTDDINDNTAESPSEQFELPPNWDVSMNGETYIEDFVLVAGHYGKVGQPGWIREDVDNNGEAYIEDFVIIAGYYGEEWK